MRRLPGLALCAAIALAARLLQSLEEHVLGHPYLEGLVLAILLGITLRAVRPPGERWHPGIRFSAGPLLEAAVVLLGASLDLGAILAGGPGLLIGIAGVVMLALVLGYALGRALGLPRRMALLLACGNAICGNSAIAAVAPVIGATGREVAAAVAFTAVLGVIVVLGLPLLIPALGLSPTRYGALAGLTIYAVPQVLAATAPLGSLSMQMGTLVKLLRVLMLGPLVLALSFAAGRSARQAAGASPGQAGGRNPGRYFPWFITGFLLVAGCNALGLVPAALLGPLKMIAAGLTATAMAALGLGVDPAALGQAGPQVSLTVAASLLLLIGISLGCIHLLGIG